MPSKRSQYLFAYGTLRSEHPEHAKFCSHALSIQTATLAGALYQLAEGYPILEIAPSQRLAQATQNPVADWTYLSEKPNKRQADNTPQNLVEGQLIELPLTAGALSDLDQWECFVPGTNSAYQRYLVAPTKTETNQALCWVYATTAPPPTAQKLPSNLWKRPTHL